LKVKLFLEEETGTGNEKIISTIKEVADKAEAIKDKTLNKCFFHTCYHDEQKDKNSSCRPCKREAI